MTELPTALEAARRIADGSLTVEALLKACLERIGQREPHVQAWQHLDADAALERARHVDRFGSGPLKGIPVGVKDMIDTADMPTGYGSPIYESHRPQRDAACVAMARQASEWPLPPRRRRRDVDHLLFSKNQIASTADPSALVPVSSSRPWPLYFPKPNSLLSCVVLQSCDGSLGTEPKGVSNDGANERAGWTG
jgi:hypothetical protein